MSGVLIKVTSNCWNIWCMYREYNQQCFIVDCLATGSWIVRGYNSNIYYTLLTLQICNIISTFIFKKSKHNDYLFLRICLSDDFVKLVVIHFPYCMNICMYSIPTFFCKNIQYILFVTFATRHILAVFVYALKACKTNAALISHIVTRIRNFHVKWNTGTDFCLMV